MVRTFRKRQLKRFSSNALSISCSPDSVAKRTQLLAGCSFASPDGVFCSGDLLRTKTRPGAKITGQVRRCIGCRYLHSVGKGRLKNKRNYSGSMGTVSGSDTLVSMAGLLTWYQTTLPRTNGQPVGKGEDGATKRPTRRRSTPWPSGTPLCCQFLARLGLLLASTARPETGEVPPCVRVRYDDVSQTLVTFLRIPVISITNEDAIAAKQT